jgi:RNA recognition motif-containing protein
MNIFVAKLSPSTTSEDLRELFSEYGEVASANVIMDRATGHSKGFGFVEMDNDEEALKAIDELDECEYDNSQIVVKKARPKEEGERRSGGFKGGNRSDRGSDRGGYRKSRYDD